MPWWFPWIAVPAIVAAGVWFVILLRIGEREIYRPVLHERSEWGDIYAIVGPWGKVYGYDRWKPANERCAALNSARNGIPKS